VPGVPLVGASDPHGGPRRPGRPVAHAPGFGSGVGRPPNTCRTRKPSKPRAGRQIREGGRRFSRRRQPFFRDVGACRPWGPRRNQQVHPPPRSAPTSRCLAGLSPVVPDASAGRRGGRLMSYSRTARARHLPPTRGLRGSASWPRPRRRASCRRSPPSARSGPPRPP